MGKHPSEHKSRGVRWQRRFRNLRRRVVAWIAGALAWVLLRVPYSVLRPGFRVVVTPVLHAMLGRRARRNLQLALGDGMSEEEQRRVLSEMFRATAMLPAEWLGFSQMGPRFLELYVDGEAGKKQINDTERECRGGWIGVTGHIGNWELVAQWMYHIGLQPMGGIIAKRQPNPHLNRIIEKLRGRHGMATLYRDDPPRKVLRMLKGGTSIGVAGDQDVPSLAGVFIDFMGRPAYTPVGPARLAVSTGVPMLVGAAIREGDRYRVQINPPIYPDLSRPRDEEVLRLTVEWSRQIEEIVRAHPEQWPWFHNRWKTTPDSLRARQRRALDIG